MLLRPWGKRKPLHARGKSKWCSAGESLWQLLGQSENRTWPCRSALALRAGTPSRYRMHTHPPQQRPWPWKHTTNETRCIHMMECNVSIKKKWISDTCCNMEERWKQNVKYFRLVTETNVGRFHLRHRRQGQSLERSLRPQTDSRNNFEI